MKFLALFLLLTGLLQAAEPKAIAEQRRIGTMVIEIDAALKKPADKASLETIARHGTDSRHYVMIRGWLNELLKGTESQLRAARDPALKQKHQQMADFLRKAIRRIDLE